MRGQIIHELRAGVRSECNILMITFPYIEAKPLNILSDTLEKTEKIHSVILKFSPRRVAYGDNIQNLKNSSHSICF